MPAYRLFSNPGLPQCLVAAGCLAASDRTDVEIVRIAPQPGGGAEHQGRPLPYVLDGNGDVMATGVDEVCTWLGASGDQATIALVQQGLLGAARRAGFAHTRDEYEPAYHEVFATLTELDQRLAARRYLDGGEAPTATDWWAFAVLVKFDAVDYVLYKCNARHLDTYEHLLPYLRDLFQLHDVDDHLDYTAIKQQAYWEDERINPKQTYPLGGEHNLLLPHDRAERFVERDLVQVGTEEDPSKRRARGEWVRGVSAHRHRVTADGSSGYLAEANRYHLYVAFNCPWCHRTTLTRAILGLEDIISMDVTWFRRDAEKGWQFRPEEPGSTTESQYGYRYIKELYERVGSTEKSLPVLWDKKTETIVSNESAEILRMMNDGFASLATRKIDLYPAAKRDEIDRLNAWIYTDINNGAYKAGFTGSQKAYEIAYHRFFAAMDRLETILARQCFLTGETITEADVRLFPTLFRFDAVYHVRFRLNAYMLRDRPALSRWLRDMYEQPGVAAGSNLRHAKQGYFGRNANQIVPLGPEGEVLGLTPADRSDGV